MQWPADVIAFYAIRAGMAPAEAAVAVAVALSGTEGDDAYQWAVDAPGGRSYLGAWAIRDDIAAEHPDLDPMRLAQAAQMVRRLTGRTGDNWAWSDVHATGDWRKRLDDATEAVTHPQAGITSDLPQLSMTMDDAIEARRSAITSARTSMLNSVEHLRKLV